MGRKGIHKVSAFSSELGLVLGQEKVAGKSSGFERTGRSHGRVVAQVVLAAAAGEAIDPAQWPGCKTVGYVVSQRVVKGAPAKVEERYYISSRELSAQQLERINKIRLII